MNQYHVIFYLCFVLLSYQFENNTLYSVVHHHDHLQIVEGSTDDALAWGTYSDTIHQNGWAKITLHSKVFDFKNAFALGFLEGALTADRIYNQYFNTFQNYEKISDNYKDFIIDQYEWTLYQVKKNYDDPYWIEVGKFMEYFQGLLQGQNKFSKDGQQISLYHFLFLQASGGDNSELDTKFNNSQHIWKNVTQGMKYILKSHCSALIKQVGTEVFMGHTTWSNYNQMQRLYKFFKFGENIDFQFSGYFGMMYSTDDFYVLNKQKILVIETTNNVMDESLLSLIQPQSLLSWQRIMIANFMASSGKEWTQIYIKHNSGTYNNQFMVVDSSKFDRTTSIPQSDFLWVIEQMPGKYESGDMTDVFVKNGGVWVSYNVPYFKKMYDYSGYKTAYEKEGDEYSYEKCPRAQIFARDNSKVTDMDSYKALMRYNQFQTDPLSNDNAMNAIASRGDLNKRKNFALFGSVDCKVINLSNLENGQQSEIQSGPTSYGQQPFSWDDYKEYKENRGHPRTFDFDWVNIKSD